MRVGIEAKHLHTNFFWAGPRAAGAIYEFTRVSNGRMYVRYLTAKSQIGHRKTPFLTISTYPRIGAYDSLKAKAKPGKNGSLLWKDPKSPTSVYMVFKAHPDFEVEVFDPNKAKALATAKSGKVRLVVGS